LRARCHEAPPFRHSPIAQLADTLSPGDTVKRFVYEITESWKIAAAQMRSNMTRSTLTALGVIIGIVAVTLMGTAINGIQTGFDNSMSVLGDDVVYVNQWPWARVNDWWNYRDRKKIKTEYAAQLNRMIAATPNSNLVIAVPRASFFRSIKYAANEVSNIFVMGTTSDYVLTSTVDCKEGRFFNELESRDGSNVCVIGYDVADALFAKESPIGKSVLINGQQFKVLGVNSRQGTFLGLFSWDSMVVMPLPAFNKYFSAKSESDILVKVKDKTKLGDAKDELTGLMRRVRALPPEKKDDFSINEQQAFKSTLDPVKNSIAIAGLFITGLSLFVGAIGIMNITFVSVKERTKEIGTRKALGARRRTILLQFLIESTALCLLGGFLGLGIAYAICMSIAAALPSFPIHFSVGLVFMSMVVSVMTGLVSGFAPAWSASRLDPVAALRYE
jgi:putative ABC transport system permease protein